MPVNEFNEVKFIGFFSFSLFKKEEMQTNMQMYLRLYNPIQLNL
jgi:hypothetical protein